MPLSYLPAFWLAWTGRGALSLIAQNVTLSLLSFLLYGIFIRQRMGWMFQLGWRFERGLARRFLLYGAQSGAATFVTSMLAQLDNFVVGTRSGTVALGFYDRGYRTAQWPNLLLGPLLARSALFTYAQLKDDTLRLRRSVSMVIWLIVGMATPIALALFVAAPDLVRWLYGERWLPAVPILRVLVIAALLRPIWDNAFVLFVGTGRALHIIWIGVVQLAIIFGLGWLLAGYFGPLGVAVAVVVAYTLGLIIAHFLTADNLQLDVVNLFVKPLLVAGLVMAGYWLLNQALPINSWPLPVRTVSKAVYAVLAYYLGTFVVQPRATMERIQYIRRLLRRQPQGESA
jgi:PST family polysaccharide transporter